MHTAISMYQRCTVRSQLSYKPGTHPNLISSNSLTLLLFSAVTYILYLVSRLLVRKSVEDGPMSSWKNHIHLKNHILLLKGCLILPLCFCHQSAEVANHGVKCMEKATYLKEEEIAMRP